MKLSTVVQLVAAILFVTFVMHSCDHHNPLAVVVAPAPQTINRTAMDALPDPTTAKEPTYLYLWMCRKDRVPAVTVERHALDGKRCFLHPNEVYSYRGKCEAKYVDFDGGFNVKEWAMVDLTDVEEMKY